MMLPWPTVAEERALAVQRNSGIAAESPWRAYSLPVWITFFVLTSLALLAFWWLCDDARLNAGYMTAVVALLGAEVLIRFGHFAETGIEGALWLGGLVSLITALPGEESPEVLLLFALAAALAAGRLRNPIFATGAAGLVVSYFGAKEWPQMAALSGVAISLAALGLMRIEWRRPSTEAMLAMILLVTPITGAAWSVRPTPWPWALLYLGFSAVCAWAAVRLRQRAPLIAVAIGLAIAGVEIEPLLRLPVEWDLILGGALLLACAGVVARLLSGARSGLVLGDERSSYEEALQLAGAILVTPKSEPLSEPALEPGGGKFGGAGATGDY